MGQARCVRVTRGKDQPSAKGHTEKKRKAHHTMKHMQKCPWTPSHEVCPCTHTPLVQPHAQQGINKETYPPPNKPPPRAPRRRPTTHVLILCFLHSRPFAQRKEAWYEGHPYVTKSREPHAIGGRTTATKHTYHKNPGAQEEQEVCRAHICRRKQQKVWMYITRATADGDTCNADAPSSQRNRHPFSFPEHAHPIGRHRRSKCGDRHRPNEEQEATNTAERNKDGHRRGRKPPTPEKMWTPPKNTRRTRSRQHRGTEHEWYEGIPNGKKRWYEGRPTP